MSATVTCIQCFGRGYVLVPREGFAPSARRCECRLSLERSREDLVRVLQRAGMATDEIRSAMKPWEVAPNPRPAQLDELMRWVRAVAGGVEVFGQSADADEPWAWLLWGRVGTGKSKAAAMAACEYVKARGRGLVWVTSREAVEQVMFERSTSETRTSDTQDRIISAGFLVLDEYGTERDEHGGEVDRWVSSRHRRGSPTIMVTNADSASGIDGRISSRLLTAERMHFDGVDYRRHEAKREAQERSEEFQPAGVVLEQIIDDLDGGVS